MMYPIYAHCEERRSRLLLIIMCGGAAGAMIDYTAPHRIDRVLNDFPNQPSWRRMAAGHGVQEVLHVAFRR